MRTLSGKDRPDAEVRNPKGKVVRLTVPKPKIVTRKKDPDQASLCSTVQFESKLEPVIIKDFQPVKPKPPPKRQELKSALQALGTQNFDVPMWQQNSLNFRQTLPPNQLITMENPLFNKYIDQLQGITRHART